MHMQLLFVSVERASFWEAQVILHKVSRFVRERRKFETFHEEAGGYPGSFPVSSTAAEPNARILTTQNSSKFLMPN